MPDKEGAEEKSTKSVVNKKQKQMMGEEGYDVARDMGKVKPSKDKKDATTMPPSKEMEKTRKVNKGPSALERVKKKYKGQIMKMEELDLTQVAKAFGGYIVEETQEEKKKREEANKIKTTSKPARVQGRQDATNPKEGGHSHVDLVDDDDYKKAKTMGTPTKTIGSMKTYNANKNNRPPRKGVDYFFDAEKAKKAKDEFRKGRKAYTDSTSGIKAGKVTQKGIVNYITKARDLNQGTNANTKANRKAAEIIAKSSGSEYAEKIRKKYETDKDLPRKRGRNQPSYAEIKKGIDARNPVKPGQFTGKPVPANTPVKIIKTTVTDKEIQDIIKQGKQAIPKKSSRVTAAKLGDVDTAIKKIDDLIIEPKAGDAEKTKKLLKKQQRIITKKITTPKPGEIEQQQKILDKTQTKPKVTKVKGNLFDPTGRIADETKKANQSFKDFIKKLKTKHPKPKLSLYDPLKTKINVEPLKPLRTFIKPSITKTATKSKGLIPKLLKAASKNPKAALGVGLLTLGTYGAIKNRIKTKTPAPNKNKLLPGGLGNRETVIDPLDVTYKIVGNKNR